MKPRRFACFGSALFGPAVLVLLAALVIPCLGCVTESEPYQVNPFAAPADCPCPDGACPCPDGTCPGPNGTCPDGSCPGGQCPVPNQDASGGGGGTEISSDGRYQVNELALIETKSGPPCPAAGIDVITDDRPPTGIRDFETATQIKQARPCPTCPLQVQPSQFVPLQIRPVIQPPQQARPAASVGDQVKTGAFRCEQCKRPTVGQQWQEIWADDGTSLMCMCRDCFGRSSPAQREQVLRNFAARSSIDLSRRPAVETAIREAATGF